MLLPICHTTSTAEQPATKSSPWRKSPRRPRRGSQSRTGLRRPRSDTLSSASPPGAPEPSSCAFVVERRPRTMELEGRMAPMCPLGPRGESSESVREVMGSRRSSRITRACARWGRCRRALATCSPARASRTRRGRRLSLPGRRRPARTSLARTPAAHADRKAHLGFLCAR